MIENKLLRCGGKKEDCEIYQVQMEMPAAHLEKSKAKQTPSGPDAPLKQANATAGVLIDAC